MVNLAALNAHPKENRAAHAAAGLVPTWPAR
jgi:hypothetical protein